MTTIRQWRASGERHLPAPTPVTIADIEPLNRLFSDAFTDRYRKDGLVGVRVPELNPAVWRYAIRDAGTGALHWRHKDEIIAFNIVHRSGIEGWMGPLAVRPDWQGHGFGREVVRSGIEWLEARGASVIGLETMPRTMDNIGFYSRLGFLPGHLTLTLTFEASAVDQPVTLLSRVHGARRAELLEACRRLTDRQIRGYDYTREIELTDDLELGDTVMIERNGTVAAYALFHTVPLVDGRAREEVRALKIVADETEDIDDVARALAGVARESGAKRVAIRVQGEYRDAYARLTAMGARVRWSDLRMTLRHFDEPRATTGLLLSNWEI